MDTIAHSTMGNLVVGNYDLNPSVRGGLSSANGSAASGAKQAFLMNYDERTGAFGRPRYYSYGNAPAAVTHFEGITAVPGGFNLVAISSAQEASMAFVPASVRHGYLGPARWYPVNVAASSLCPSGCSVVTGNTVYRKHIMGLYIPSGTTGLHTYLAAVAGR